MPKRISKSMREYLKMEKRLSEKGARLYMVVDPASPSRKATVKPVNNCLESKGKGKAFTGINDRHFAEDAT